MVFGGVWQEWSDESGIIKTCAIVTTASNSKLSRIHHRLPLVLERSDWGFWLGEEGHGASALMKPTADDTLKAYRVSKNINSNRSCGPDLMSPLLPNSSKNHGSVIISLYKPRYFISL